jgi:hypothetical protein
MSTTHSARELAQTAVWIRGVPSGKWLEFAVAISGNMKVSVQAARSMG